MGRSLSLGVASVAAVTLAACGQTPSPTAEAPPAEPAATATAAAEAPAPRPNPTAIRFFTENAPPEDAADTREDGVLRDATNRPYVYYGLGEAVPEFSLATVDGGAFTNEDLTGAWTIVDFWGLWCSDCIADGDQVAQLAEAVGEEDGLRFVSIHTPSRPERAETAFGRWGSVDAYFEEKGYTYPTAIDTDASIRNAFQISWTPTYLLVDPEGVIRGFRTDLSVAGEDAVAGFIDDVNRVRTEG